MREFIGKQVRVIFDDGEDRSVPKTGELLSVDEAFVVILTDKGREALPISRIIRCFEYGK